MGIYDLCDLWADPNNWIRITYTKGAPPWTGGLVQIMSPDGKVLHNILTSTKHKSAFTRRVEDACTNFPRGILRLAMKGGFPLRLIARQFLRVDTKELRVVGYEHIRQ
ncbi:MAG: hypothetical protein GWO20_00625 [Candidatus Korarchaeota archaeon]|nr:hypothetical protein [Candidatus Korarchaeota archaeon]